MPKNQKTGANELGIQGIASLDKVLDGSGQPGLHELRDLLGELLDGPSVDGSFIGHQNLQRRSMRVFRLRFSIDGSIRTWIVKRLAPEIAQRNELVAKRWLPAVGLNDLGPSLAGSVADRSGAWVWHVYHDLGPHELDPQDASVDAIRTAIEQIARMHTRFARHALLGEVRLHGGDLGVHFVESNMRDAIYALESCQESPLRQELRDRLLRRLYTIRSELPQGTGTEEVGRTRNVASRRPVDHQRVRYAICKRAACSAHRLGPCCCRPLQLRPFDLPPALPARTSPIDPEALHRRSGTRRLAPAYAG